MSESNKKSFPEKFHGANLSAAEAITGLLSAKKEDLVLSAGHMIQGLINYELFDVFRNEWKKWREKGKIKDDYQQTDQFQELFAELIELLERETVAKEKMKLINKLFLIAGSEIKSDRNSFLPVEYMKIAKSLTVGEILTLIAAHKVALDNSYPKENFASADEWLKKVASESELVYPELVENFERELMKKRLITGRKHTDESGVVLPPNYRLTTLGFNFCGYISEYDTIISEF